MTIVPIPRKNCPSVLSFFCSGGEVEIPRPEQCRYAKCLLKAPLRKNGSYTRQVVYWGLVFLVLIFRFRCQRCGKTISCPYSWLVPYRRFAAEAVAEGIERYADTEVTYRSVGTELSDMEFVDPAFDIRRTEMYKQAVQEESQIELRSGNGAVHSISGKSKVKTMKARTAADGSESQRPCHTTVFYWVNFLCAQAEKLLSQIQKEFVREWKRSQRAGRLQAASIVMNPNYEKACSLAKGQMLNQLTLLSLAAKELVDSERHQWQNLRAYFQTKAESCKDILTSKMVVLTRTHTFELDLF